MYYCKECGREFESAETITQTHGLLTPPFEEIYVCPFCSGTDISAVQSLHCRCCGARLPDGASSYCNENCRSKGEKMWRREAVRRKRERSLPLNIIIRQLEEYNRMNGTSYSYGQYVALVLAKSKRGGKR